MVNKEMKQYLTEKFFGRVFLLHFDKNILLGGSVLILYEAKEL